MIYIDLKGLVGIVRHVLWIVIDISVWKRIVLLAQINGLVPAAIPDILWSDIPEINVALNIISKKGVYKNTLLFYNFNFCLIFSAISKYALA